jgi:Family of unknown function (DUF6370)
MKTLVSSGLAMAVFFFVVAGVRADDKKEVTLKGELMCAKCELKVEGVTKCQTVLQVKQGDELVTYYFKDKGSKEEYHESVCGGGRKHATVTGVVTEKNGKKWLTPSKVDVS